MADETKTSSPTATDADLARVLTRQDEPDDRSDEIRQLREENARLRKWDELTKEIDRDEQNENDSKHYAQALVQHARQQRAAREAREAREAEKEFKAAEAASSLCITERGAGPHDTFVRAVIKGDNPKIARAPKKNPVVVGSLSSLMSLSSAFKSSSVSKTLLPLNLTYSPPFLK